MGAWTDGAVADDPAHRPRAPCSPTPCAARCWPAGSDWAWRDGDAARRRRGDPRAGARRPRSREGATWSSPARPGASSPRASSCRASSGVPPLARPRGRRLAPRARVASTSCAGSGSCPSWRTGGIPSRERALGDRETADVAAWVDAPGDARVGRADPAATCCAPWTGSTPCPTCPRAPRRGRSGSTSTEAPETCASISPSWWARRGRAAGAPRGVRLQLDHGGRMTSYGEGAEVDDAARARRARPTSSSGRTSVRLDGLRYRIRSTSRAWTRRARRRAARVTGEIDPRRRARPLAPAARDPRRARAGSPATSCPSCRGRWAARSRSAIERSPSTAARGYHDHNWGFWDGVTWQWGQVQHDELSFVYGRVRPPAGRRRPRAHPRFPGRAGPGRPDRLRGRRLDRRRRTIPRRAGRGASSCAATARRST